MPQDLDLRMYPGCGRHGTSMDLYDSLESVMAHLGFTFNELEDWNCCGSTAAVARAGQHELAAALPIRNLAIANQNGKGILMPCSACYHRTLVAQHEYNSEPELKAQVDAALPAMGLSYEGEARVVHTLELLHSMVGPEKIKAAFKRDLKGLKLAPYYGCLTSRPKAINVYSAVEHPTEMDELIELTGATVTPYQSKTKCCGGSLILLDKPTTDKICMDLVEEARANGADAIVTICPMCQMNLEIIQRGDPNAMPVLYLHQLLGLAMGLDEEKDLCLHQSLIPHEGMMAKVGVHS